MRSYYGFILLIMALLSWSPSGIGQNRDVKDAGRRKKPQIVFVCEHGAALSVVSAAYFNKMAQDEHLPLHAIARGTSPQPDLAVSARDGLKADHVLFEAKRPEALSAKDMAQARQIIAFCPLPAKYSRSVPMETWSDVPPTGANYGLARDAIVRHLRDLIARLKAAEAKP